MRINELRPTEENIRNTYLNDTIGRNSDVNAFVDILNTLENSCAIALDGVWGSGKTFFVQQVKMVLDACCRDSENADKQSVRRKWTTMHNGKEPEFQSQLCVYYDAWENDNDEDPVLSLVYSILQDVDAESPFETESGIFDKGAAIAECLSGRSITAVVDSLKSKDTLSDLRKKKQIQTEVKNFFDELLTERANRLVIIVDELDRCKPEYAVRLLERVKHYFADDRISFVFSTNIKELQHTIARFYGEGFDAVRYFDRFFDLRIALPPVDMDSYLRSINFDKQYVVDRVCYELIEQYALSLRESSRFIQFVNLAVHEPTHESHKYDFSFPDGKAKLFGLMYVVPLLVVLKMTNNESYNQFVEGKNVTPLVNLLENIQMRDDWSYSEFLSIAENGHDAIEHTKSAFERVDISHSLDTGFRVLKCDTSNMKDVYYNPAEYEVNMFSRLEDNIKEDRTPEDLLFQVMLDLGVLLSSKIEETTIAGKKVFNVEDNYLIACFDSDVSEETIKAIAKQKPYYFVMRDSSMASDSVATNFDQIFATYSPDTVRKVL